MKNSYKNLLILISMVIGFVSIALVIGYVSIAMGIIGSIGGVSMYQDYGAVFVLPLPSIARILMNLAIVVINYIMCKKNKTSNLLAVFSIILVIMLPICNIVLNRYMQLIYISKGVDALSSYSVFENSLLLAKVFANVSGLILCSAMGVSMYNGLARSSKVNVWFNISFIFCIVSIWICYEMRSELIRELLETPDAIPTYNKLTFYEIFAFIIPTIIIAATIFIKVLSIISKSYIVIVTVLMAILQIVYEIVRGIEISNIGLNQSTVDIASYGSMTGMIYIVAIPVMFVAEVFFFVGLGQESNKMINPQKETLLD